MYCVTNNVHQVETPFFSSIPRTRAAHVRLRVHQHGPSKGPQAPLTSLAKGEAEEKGGEKTDLGSITGKNPWFLWTFSMDLSLSLSTAIYIYIYVYIYIYIHLYIYIYRERESWICSWIYSFLSFPIVSMDMSNETIDPTIVTIEIDGHFVQIR